MQQTLFINNQIFKRWRDCHSKGLIFLATHSIYDFATFDWLQMASTQLNKLHFAVTVSLQIVSNFLNL